MTEKHQLFVAISGNTMTALYASKRQESRERRARHRAASPKLLDNEGLIYSTHNGNAHLVVHHPLQPDVLVDFWPGTGLWSVRNTGFKSRGVKSLIHWFSIQKTKDETSEATHS